ncbi:MAG: SDR family oxidoreductase [Acidobacteria bacterium]|nr:SDR family oxidoreductase [Acidobacteriota bacterium]
MATQTANTVFVTGATGTVGSLVVAGLLAKGSKVRALVRSEESGAQALRDQGVEVFIGDFTDDAVLDQATAGVDKVFSLTPPNPDQVEQANAITAAAQRSPGEPHVVRLSVMKSSTSAPSIVSAQHGEIDIVLRDSGLPVTFLKPNFFMQNTLLGAGTVGEQGVIYHAMGDGKLGMIDARDIADVAVEVLTTDGHEGKGYTLTGPESISFAQLAVQLSEVVGREVQAVDVPVDAAKQSMVDMGLPEWVAGALAEYSVRFSNNYADFFTDDVKNITGKSARTYKELARDFVDAYA